MTRKEWLDDPRGMDDRSLVLLVQSAEPGEHQDSTPIENRDLFPPSEAPTDSQGEEVCASESTESGGIPLVATLLEKKILDTLRCMMFILLAIANIVLYEAFFRTVPAQCSQEVAPAILEQNNRETDEPSTIEIQSINSEEMMIYAPAPLAGQLFILLSV